LRVAPNARGRTGSSRPQSAPGTGSRPAPQQRQAQAAGAHQADRARTLDGRRGVRRTGRGLGLARRRATPRAPAWASERASASARGPPPRPWPRPWTGSSPCARPACSAWRPTAGPPGCRAAHAADAVVDLHRVGALDVPREGHGRSRTGLRRIGHEAAHRHLEELLTRLSTTPQPANARASTTTAPRGAGRVSIRASQKKMAKRLDSARLSRQCQVLLEVSGSNYLSGIAYRSTARRFIGSPAGEGRLGAAERLHPLRSKALHGPRASIARFSPARRPPRPAPPRTPRCGAARQVRRPKLSRNSRVVP